MKKKGLTSELHKGLAKTYKNIYCNTMTVKTDTYSQNVKMSFHLWVLSISNTHFSSECTAVLIYWCAVAFLVYREISSSVDCRCFCPAPDILGRLEAEMKDRMFELFPSVPFRLLQG